MRHKVKKSSLKRAVPDKTALVLFNKPFQVLSQFTDDSERDRKTLAEFIPIKQVYAAGRLDFDSEGLLLLTDNGAFQSAITHPKFKLAKTYYAQLDNEISEVAVQQLRSGVTLKDGKTRRAEVAKISEPEWLWPRNPAVRYRKEIPTSWIKLTLTEGKNRQVRRMTAAVGFPTLRLIRYSIGAWSIKDLAPGTYLHHILETNELIPNYKK